jgi:hypothetical protein
MNKRRRHLIPYFTLHCRLVWKADILMGQVKDQFPPPAEIDANSVLKGHTVDR